MEDSKIAALADLQVLAGHRVTVVKLRGQAQALLEDSKIAAQADLQALAGHKVTIVKAKPTVERLDDCSPGRLAGPGRSQS